ncbi:MAG: diacylglycerol kinase, partial [Atopobiaceae bacterium]|nr:diacylglycerol kinase [Atopobiaceae bacterium]
MRTLIVHNPKAGFGSDAIFAFERALVHQGDECVFRSLAHERDSKAALADAESFDCVVISGGDGTVSSLLYALKYRDVLTCVFPSGTANLLFASLGCASEPAAIARACRSGRYALCDLVEMRWQDSSGKRYYKGFSVMAGTGFDAEIMRAAIPNKQAMGQMSYFAAALTSPKPPVYSFDIEIDGQHYQRDAISCVVSNNAMIQAEIEIIPDCRMDDGVLDLAVIETGEAALLLKPIAAAIMDRSGKILGRPHIEHFSGKHIRVSSSTPLPLEIDGEAIQGDCFG